MARRQAAVPLAFPTSFLYDRGMSEGISSSESSELATKIGLLVEERGWNQEEFARIARLNRHTVRQILLRGEQRKLRNATISSCAKALGLSVNDLRTVPIEHLLPRMRERPSGPAGDDLRGLLDQVTQPELLAWLQRHPDRASQLRADELAELLALQNNGAGLSAFGVDGFVERIERRRRLMQRVQEIAGTEYVDLLDQIVGLIYDRVRATRERASKPS